MTREVRVPLGRRPAHGQACVICAVRWGQNSIAGLGLVCRRCLRQRGDTRGTRELQTDRMRAAPERVPDAAPKPKREVVADGRVFEVVWDGTR